MTAAAARLVRPLIDRLEFLAPLADLGIRLWIAKFFWDSGLTKINVDASFPFLHMNPTTLTLFQTEYHVPVLAPAVAAYLGTAVELTFPVLLALGLGGRIAAAVLFVFNIVAVISYPGLEEFGLAQHQLYGTLLLLPLLRGPGKISIDYFIRRIYWR
ncbi:MAG: DoxX family protein [Sulfurifustaceae bacterium]